MRYSEEMMGCGLRRWSEAWRSEHTLSPEIFRRQNWPDLVSETELGQLGNQLCSYHESLGRNQKQCTNEVILNLRTLFRVLHWGIEGNLLRWPFTSFFPNHRSISVLLQTSQKRPLWLLSTPIFSLSSYYTLLFTVFNVRGGEMILTSIS